jgi:hypothetical protein
MGMNLELIERCGALDGAAIGEGAFAPGPAIWVGKREVAHFDADGAVDVRLTKEVIRSRRSEFRRDDRVSLRANDSDWLEIKVDTACDLEFAVSLVKDAVAANLPTAKAGAPPTGEELDRRRRFH